MKNSSGQIFGKSHRAKILVFHLLNFWSFIRQNFGLSFAKILVNLIGPNFWSFIRQNFGKSHRAKILVFDTYIKNIFLYILQA